MSLLSTHESVLLLNLGSGLTQTIFGVAGFAVSALYLLNQGDILATAMPGFPVRELAGLLGSTGWGLWVAALGVSALLHPIVGAIPFENTPTGTRSPTEAGLRNRTRRSMCIELQCDVCASRCNVSRRLG